MIVNPTCVVFLTSLAGAAVSGFVSPSNGYTASRRSTPTMSLDTGRSKISLKAATMETMTSSETFVSVSPDEQETADVQQAKSYLDDGFVFGLEGSGLERPKGKAVNLVVEGDTLETTPKQMAFVSATFLGHAAFYATALASMLSINGGNVALTAAQALGVTVSSLILADLGSGILHWSVDNYGNGRTPIMGGIIAAFQGHHSAPWTITQRQFCNNVSKLCIPFGVPTVALINYLAGPTHPTMALFFSMFCTMEILSQEFHKWSHMRKGEVPGFVNKLQDLGLTVDRKSHALHHMAPYDGKYCIVSGFCNNFLDNSGFLRRLEHIVYKINGVEANSWKLDPELREKTLRGEYKLS